MLSADRDLLRIQWHESLKSVMPCARSKKIRRYHGNQKRFQECRNSKTNNVPIPGYFHIDSQIQQNHGSDYKKIRKSRTRELRPKLDELLIYLDESVERVSERSEIYKAIECGRSNKVELYRFLEDGRLELSNNLAERSQKPVIIGQKNSMLLGSARGVQSIAVIYSLVQNM